MSDFNCTFCISGYEAKSTDDATCIVPANFKPRRGWEGSLEQLQLRLLNTSGRAVKPDPDTGVAVLLKGYAYTVSPPPLIPKENEFVGYAQPGAHIQYELDFSLGAEVDIGCGTFAVGDGTHDPVTPKEFALRSPLSMHEFSFLAPDGRGDLKADPPDPGFYPFPCTRFHRFRVIKPGNFTFVRAA